MKKILNHELCLADVKNAIAELKKDESKKNQYILIGVMITLIAAAMIGIAWMVKKNLEEKENNDWDEDWDDDWDDEEEDTACDDACCCTDKDVDTSVKIEQV